MSKTARDIMQKKRNELFNQILEDIKNEDLKWIQGWNSKTGNPYNALSNTVYKGINRFKLAYIANKNDWKDNRWLTYKQAKQLGGTVKKGETGTIIEHWNSVKTKTETTDNDGNTISNEKIDFVYRDKYYTVFNIAQIDGIPELEEESKEENIIDDYTLISDDFIKSSRCNIFENSLYNCPCYDFKEDNVYLIKRNEYNDTKYFLQSLLHEMAHSTSRSDEVKRKMYSIKDDVNKYAREELVAELSSIFIMAEVLGTENNDFSDSFKNSIAYIKSWLLKEDNCDELFSAINTAFKASDYLIDNYKKCKK